MAQVMLYTSAELAVVTDLVSHALYNNWEPTLPSFCRNHLLLLAASAALTSTVYPGHYKHVFWATVLFNFVYLTTLALSIACYRLFFHPLKKFPGPLPAKLTKWTTTYQSKDGYSHRWLASLHAKYGPVVRTGPNELSFSSPSSVKHIHGAQGARLHRGPFYDAHTHNATGRGKSLMKTRDWKNHRLRQRVWDHGFSQKSLRSYEPRLLQIMDDPCEALEQHNGRRLDWSAYSDYFTFDVMGALSFNKSFNLLKPDGPHDLPACIRTGIKLNFLLATISWLSPFFQWIPISQSTKNHTRRSAFLGRQQYVQRRPQGTEPNDNFSHILAGNEKQEVTTENELAADAAILFVGGSDPVTVVATFMIYVVLHEPKIYQRLRQEVDAHWDGLKPLEGSSLGRETYPLLNAVINETMRVIPPGPNGFQRFTAKGGHQVDGIFVPENTALSSNTIALHHNSDAWTNPLEFVPERWIDQERDPPWIHDTRAFVPFSVGTFSCVGKSLAMLELRMLLATLVRKFDLALADNSNQEEFWREYKSFMGTVKGDMPIVVRKRAA